MSLKTANEIDAWLAPCQRDRMAKLGLMHAIRRAVLWLPIAYHLEMPNPWKPGPTDQISFFVLGTIADRSCSSFFPEEDADRGADEAVRVVPTTFMLES